MRKLTLHDKDVTQDYFMQNAFPSIISQGSGKVIRSTFISAHVTAFGQFKKAANDFYSYQSRGEFQGP